MYRLGIFLAKKNFILRSGGADGADTAFENGCNKIESGKKEIFLPWKGFNGNESILFEQLDYARIIANSIHPNFKNCRDTVKKLHTRNVHQILGQDLNTPSSFVVAWTPDGLEYEENYSFESGGTGTAIVLACRNDIPVFNLKNKNSLLELMKFIGVK